MTEKERILKTLSDLYDGRPWTDLSILQVVGDLTAEQASSKPLLQMHSVWAYLNHIVFWRKKIIALLSGHAAPPGDDPLDSAPRIDNSEAAWRETLNDLRRCHEDLMTVVSDLAEKRFEEMEESLKATNYEMIQGIIQHDAYHLGQAMIVKKVVAAEGRIIV